MSKKDKKEFMKLVDSVMNDENVAEEDKEEVRAKVEEMLEMEKNLKKEKAMKKAKEVAETTKEGAKKYGRYFIKGVFVIAGVAGVMAIVKSMKNTTDEEVIEESYEEA